MSDCDCKIVMADFHGLKVAVPECWVKPPCKRQRPSMVEQMFDTPRKGEQ
jgi:hypothetical protein